MVIEKVWGKKTPLSTFIPGAIAGYIVFGRNDKINLQVLRRGTNVGERGISVGGERGTNVGESERDECASEGVREG